MRRRAGRFTPTSTPTKVPWEDSLPYTERLNYRADPQGASDVFRLGAQQARRIDNGQQVNHVGFTMKTATVRDLRTKFPVLARWIDSGESIEITRRGRVIAHLTPAGRGKKAAKPDILKRIHEIYGDYVMPEEESKEILDYNKGRY